MLAELLHFARHAPRWLAMSRSLPQDALYAHLIGLADAQGLAERRRRLATDLRGTVLEIGCGTGAMRPYFDGCEVIGLEPDAAFAARARGYSKVLAASADAIPLPDASVDAAVSALVMCSVPSADTAAKELARVVRPGGEVRLLEHVRSEGRVTGMLMDVANPLWLVANRQGCRMNRDPMPALAAAGLVVDRVEPFQLFTTGLPAFPMRMIFARRA